MKSGFGILTAVLVVVSTTFESRAGEEPGLRGGGQLLVDHQPHPVGGAFSDTDLPYLGLPFWQRLADDILLTQPPPGPVTHIVWWGFYGGTFDEVPEPPPATETMRIRFYDARPTDGLPGSALFEETLLDPLRTPTGRRIGLGPLPPEYIFEADLTTPYQLDANVPYWLEIVQLGDLNSTFRWEFSIAQLTGQAFINASNGDWQNTAPQLTGDTAFQLWTVPEPTSVVLFALGMCLFGRRSPKEHRYRP